MKQGRWNCCMCASFHVCMFVSLCAVSVCACCVTRLAVCACRPNLTLRETNMGVFSHFLDPIITGDHLTRQEKQRDTRGKQRERERGAALAAAAAGEAAAGGSSRPSSSLITCLVWAASLLNFSSRVTTSVLSLCFATPTASVLPTSLVSPDPSPFQRRSTT